MAHKSSPLKLVSKKAEAVLYTSAGVLPEIIAQFVDRQPSTVMGWLADWCDYRMASIFTGHANNENAAILTSEQRAQMRRDMALKPEDHGIPGKFWNVPTLRAYCFQEFKVLYQSDSSYHYLLRFAGLEFKYPDTVDSRRDDEAIEARMTEIHAQVTPLINDDTVEVFCADEVRIEQETHTRRAWLAQGKKTVLRVVREGRHQSYLGLLNQKSFNVHLYRLDWQNSQTIAAALAEFLKEYPGKRIVVVWDNASFHVSAKAKKALDDAGVSQRIEFIQLPPYAPDHNPIEHVWNTGKANDANIVRKSFDETREEFEEFIASRTFEYRL